MKSVTNVYEYMMHPIGDELGLIAEDHLAQQTRAKTVDMYVTETIIVVEEKPGALGTQHTSL